MLLKYIYPKLIEDFDEEEIIEEPGEEEKPEEEEEKPEEEKGFSEEEKSTKESKTNKDQVVKFTEKAVKEYLDKCINFWREEDIVESKYYTDAFQSVRTSLFGKLKERVNEQYVEDTEESIDEKEMPVCKKCGKKHWPFQKCEGVKEDISGWREAVGRSKLRKMKKSDREKAEEEIEKKDVKEEAEDNIQRVKSEESNESKNHLIEMKVTDDVGNELEIYLIDDDTSDTVISVNGREFRFDSEFVSMWRDEETGELSEEGLKELALDAVSSLDQDDYNVLVAVDDVHEEDEEDEEVVEEGIDNPGVRDGTGPAKGSAQKSISDKGRRKEAGEECPFEEEKESKADKGNEEK